MVNSKTLSGTFTRLLLETVQQHLTARYYQDFLQSSGLGRYALKLPQADLDAAATYDEVGQFMAAIYTVTTEPVYVLLSQNLGNTMITRAIQRADWQNLKARIQQELMPQRLPVEQTLQYLCDWKNTVPNQALKWRMQGAEILTERKDCIFCHNMQAGKPICYTRRVYLTGILNWLTDWQFQGEETECQAIGGATCAYRFRLISTRAKSS